MSDDGNQASRRLAPDGRGTAASGGREASPTPGSPPDLGKALLVLIPALRSYARALAGDRALADDLVQEALLRALAARNSPSEVEEIRPWAFTILRHLHFSGLRRRRTELRLLAEQLGEAEGPRFGTADGAGAMLDLERQLLMLPVEQREAVVLVGGQGLTYEEAAAVCGVAVGTMKARVSRARASLARLVLST